ncbi:MAG: nuclear transport factor 2 family protein [Spirulinaceae cyanobacterium SM2_1_0]|nr:nuclear transport factor 2 family protein [Spirulinaceae cyanobacterium SM2_1_0]
MTTQTATRSTADATATAIAQYFEQFNTGNFAAVARLFATDGWLQPPFEEPVVGPGAIANYLSREASGIRCFPGATSVDAGGTRVLGRVQTPFFALNVAWHFALNPHGQLAHLQIELLASPEELLQLTR